MPIFIVLTYKTIKLLQYVRNEAGFKKKETKLLGCMNLGYYEGITFPVQDTVL